MQQVHFKTFFKEKELWILIFLGILYFYRPLFLGETLFFRDLIYDFIPQKQLLVDFIQNGEWPLWDIYRHGGQPYFADPNNSVFHPSNLLFFVLPFFKAFNVIIVLHALLYLVSTYLFSRVLGLSPISSLISAVVYGFCGYSLSLINLFGRFLAMSYLPLLFLFWHLCLQEKKRRWFVLTLTIGVLQVFSGAPEVNVISLLSLLGWALLYPYPRLSVYRRLIIWILLGIFIVGIASIQLFPTVEMVIQSSRGQGMDYIEFSSSSLHPKRLPELFVPNFLGTVDLLPYDQYYWGVHLIDGDDYPYIINLYIGAVAFIFAVFGGFVSGDVILPRKLRIGLFVLFFSALLLSLGRFLPFFHVLYRYLPLVSVFRYPIKFLLAGLFPLALLTGYASERFFTNEAVPQRDDSLPPSRGDLALPEREDSPPLRGGSNTVGLRKSPSPNPSHQGRGTSSPLPWWEGSGEGEQEAPIHEEILKSTTLRGEERGKNSATTTSKILYVLWIMTLLSGLFTLAFLLSPTFARQIQLFFFGQFNKEIIFNGLRRSFIHASAMLLGVTLLYHSRLLSKKQWQYWGFAGLLILDLLSAGVQINVYASEEFFTEIPPVVQTVKAHIGDGRLLRTDNPPTIQLYAPSNEVIWGYLWNLETLDNYLSAFYHIPVLFHDDYVGLGQNHLMTLKALIKQIPWEQKLPLLSASRITAILTAEKLSLPEFQYLATLPNRSNAEFYLYRNTMAMAPIELITNWKIVNSDEEALQYMFQPTYNPQTHVVLQPAKRSFFSSIFRQDPEQATPPPSSNSSECQPAHVETRDSTTHSQTFSVSADCDGYLVFSEPFYPGWKVNIDGIETSSLRANFAFSAIFIPKGEHNIERYYSPISLLAGVFVSLVCCALLGGILLRIPIFSNSAP